GTYKFYLCVTCNKPRKFISAKIFEQSKPRNFPSAKLNRFTVFYNSKRKLFINYYFLAIAMMRLISAPQLCVCAGCCSIFIEFFYAISSAIFIILHQLEKILKSTVSYLVPRYILRTFLFFNFGFRHPVREIFKKT